MANDPFLNTPPSRLDPARGSFDVTPDDGAALANVTRFIRIGGTAGDVAVKYRDGTTHTIKALAVGEVIPLEATHILATGTTATGIEAFF